MRWLLLLLLLVPQPALAAWFKATSDHFIVYGEGSAESVRDYAERLERFDQVLASRTGVTTEPAANRLIVFLVDSTTAVQRQMGRTGTNVAGFYAPRLWGTIAVVPRRSGSGSEYDLDSQTVLFHEYAHHFMLQNAAVAYPAWYVEGFAEYFSTVDFLRDGSINIGYPARHRGYGLALLPQYPIERLLASDDRKRTDDQTEAFYGWSWLLTHYLNFAPARKGQLSTYLNSFAAGTEPIAAATKAFGPLDALEKDLRAYRDARRISYIQVKKMDLKARRIDVVALSPSQGAAMPMFMRSYRASNSKAEVDAAVADARKLAARYAAEPMALDVLAEFEFDAEQFDAAQRANDAVIAAEPANARALMRAARIAEARLGDKGTAEQWKAVRSLIVKANRAAPNDPYPLWAYHAWHGKSGTPVPKVAIDGLRRAVQLAPQVASLRFTLAAQDLRDGNMAAATRTLEPLLNDPHSADIRKAARDLLDSKGTPLPAKSGKPTEPAK